MYRFPADVEGYSSEEACRYLFDLACDVPEDGTIVELGTYKGRTAVALAQSGRRVYCVDRFQPEDYGFNPLPDHRDGKFSAAEVYRNADRYGCKLGVLVGDTTEMAWDWKHLIQRPIDLLFIDADHRYEKVKADFEAWGPFVKPNGIIVFDDVLWDGVSRLLGELRDWAPLRGWQPDSMAGFHRIAVTSEV